MMYFYILYSIKVNRYYKGVSEDPAKRLLEHNTAIKPSAYTALTDDWKIVFQIQCENKTQALKIERYFKKSANIHYLKRFMTEPLLQEQILQRFKGGPGSSRRVVTAEGAKTIH